MTEKEGAGETPAREEGKVGRYQCKVVLGLYSVIVKQLRNVS